MNYCKYNNHSSGMKSRISILILLLVGLLIYTVFSDSKREDGQINSIDALKSFIEKGQKRGYFPKKIVRMDHLLSPRLEKIDLNFRKVIEWNKEAECPPHDDEIILALSATNHSVVCHSGDAIVIMGSGNDWFEGSSGNNIIIPGRGDDLMESHGGSNIFIFEPLWGHDTINTSSQEIDKEKIAGYDGSYPYRYTSFLIFGKGVARSDLIWDENTLINTKTADSITLDERTRKSINLLFAERDESSVEDDQFIPQRQKPEKISLRNFHAESVTVRDNTGYYAQGNDGLSIVDLKKIDQPLRLSQTTLPGRAMNVLLEGELAFVSQGDHFLEGKKGWVSIIDISDPRSPLLLKDITFANPIFNVAVENGLLYVSDTDFAESKGRLHIYDISDPLNPEHISDTDLSFDAKFIAYLDRRIYLSDCYHNGVAVFDVSRACQPALIVHYRQFRNSVWAIKTAGNRLIVNQSDNLFSVMAPDLNRGIIEVCKVKTTDQTNVAGLTGYDSIIIKGDYLFRAEGYEGISVSKIEKNGICRKIESLPSDGKFIKSLYIIRNTLVAYDGREGASLITLEGVIPKSEGDSAPISPEPAPEKVDKSAVSYRKLSRDQLQTLLYKAAVENDGKKSAALCDAGADPDSSGHENQSPVEVSARLGNLDALESLLTHGGDPRANKGRSMIAAALTEEIEAMKLLQKYGGNIGQVDSDGCTTLHYIAQDGTVEMVKYLVENGVPVDAECRGGQTAVTWAEFGNNGAVISYLKKDE